MGRPFLIFLESFLLANSMQRSSTCDLAADKVGFLRFYLFLPTITATTAHGTELECITGFSQWVLFFCFWKISLCFGLLLLFLSLLLLLLLLPDFGG